MVDPGTRLPTPWAFAVVAGAAGYLAAVLVQAAAPLPSATGAAVQAVAALLLVAGPVAIDRARLAGPGRVARGGAAVAGAGWVLLALGYTVTATVGADAVALYATGTGLVFAGMVAVGVTALRAGAWSGAGRFTPLVCALYLVPAAPTFGRDDAVSALLLAGWMLAWLALGVAVARTERAADPLRSRAGVS
ncbi:hypothetical protein ACVGOW_18770 [Pseudonocardia saturnea]